MKKEKDGTGLKEQPATYGKKNRQLTPSQVPGWTQFWMINVAGAKPPRKKYHSLSDAVKDADELCTKEKRKVFILECMGIIVPAGQEIIGNSLKKVLDPP